MGHVIMRDEKTRAKPGQSGSAILETAFMVPWLFFLFVGVLDLGFFSYAAICTQNAARVGAQAASKNSFTANDNTLACQAALPEMKGLPNAYTLSSCVTQASSITDTNTVAVCTVMLDSAGESPCESSWSGAAQSCADCGVTPGARSAQVAVTYLTLPMVPIPGLLMGRIKITRVAEMRLRN